jgi:2-polyprenyl-3-methyl-5-hydroxy-6-metoxy-1,4-benzoquinol methylase
MQQPFEFVSSDAGCLSLGQGDSPYTVEFVAISDLDANTAASEAHWVGHFYAAEKRTENAKPNVSIRSLVPPAIEGMYRDDAWHRRLDLAQLLNALLGEAFPAHRDHLQRELPRQLVTLDYQRVLPVGVSRAEVLRIFTQNTQERFRRVVGEYLRGERTYDAGKYREHGVTDAGYSHIAHFGQIYTEQILLVERHLQQYPERTITVVDLGTGNGHFLLTLASHLENRGLLARVRLIGIDQAEEDMGHAKAMCRPSYADYVSFHATDITHPGFADRLRRYQADIIIANHVLEHLPVPADEHASPDREVRPGGTIQSLIINRYLQDWVLASGMALSISVPLGDDPAISISEHGTEYDADSVTSLARSLEIRTGYAIEADRILETSDLGLCTLVRTPEVVLYGGFQGEVLTISPHPTPLSTDVDIAEDFAVPFNPFRYAEPRRAPKIGDIQDRAAFEQQGHAPRQVRQFPIKMPGTDIKLPCEFAQVAEAVQLISGHNKSVNPAYESSYAYLNVFRGKTLFSSYRGLSLTCHGDQMQTLRPEYAYPPDWSYIVSNTLPTIFFEQGFDLTEAITQYQRGERVNLYDVFQAQASEDTIYRSENFGIYLLSPYVVHAAAAADQDVDRVFVKVAFSRKRFFDNRELRRNPAFAIADWYLSDTVGYIGDWLSYGHWNERFLWDDIGTPEDNCLP